MQSRPFHVMGCFIFCCWRTIEDKARSNCQGPILLGWNFWGALRMLKCLHAHTKNTINSIQLFRLSLSYLWHLILFVRRNWHKLVHLHAQWEIQQCDWYQHVTSKDYLLKNTVTSLTQNWSSVAHSNTCFHSTALKQKSEGAAIIWQEIGNSNRIRNVSLALL